MSLLNGLASAGGGLASFAANYGAEQQKADVAKQLQEGQQTFIGGENEKTRQQQVLMEQGRQGFETGLVSQRAALEQQQAILADKLLAARESAGRQETAALNAASPSPEIKSAQQFAALGPEAKRAYREEMMTKAGLPPWMLGDDAAGGPVPPSTTPTSTPDVSGSASDGTTPPKAAGSTAAPAVVGNSNAIPAAGTTPRQGLNDDFLGKLPTPAQSLVKGMVDGRISPPSSFAAAKPYWQNLIQMATTYDPSFDETTWAGRVAMRKDMASGKSAQAVTALNTALSHAGTLVDDFDKLNNTRVPAYNYLMNNASQALGGAALTKAEETRDALASEARKVFSAAGGGNLTELQEWQKNFPLNGSPTQQKAALSGFVDLLDGRLQAIADQYNRAMGRTDEPISFLQPKARAAYEKLTGRQPPTDAVGYQTGKPPAAPAQASITPDAAPSAVLPTAESPTSSSSSHPPLPPGFRVIQ